MSHQANAVALVGPDDEEGAIRPLPAVPTSQRLALALPTLEELKVLQAYGEMFAASGLFPNVTTWQAAAAIIQYGSQLGIDAFTALKDIYWIKGKPTCDASLINSLIKRDHGGDALMPVEATRERCTIRFKRREWGEYQEATVTIEDYAHLAKDPNRPTWKTNPQDMLWARNVSQIGRRHFSDTIKGLYTREEMSDATEATYRVVEPPAAETTVTAPSSPADSTAAAPSGNAERAAALKALNNKVRDRFGSDEEIAKAFGGITAKHLRDDLICWAYGLEAIKDATAEQIATAALAIGGWTRDGAKKRYLILEAAANAANHSMAIDAATVAREEGLTDPFVTDAIARALARFEAEGNALDAGARDRIARTIDDAMVP